MGTEIAINVSREETRVAVLENKVVTELFPWTGQEKKILLVTSTKARS